MTDLLTGVPTCIEHERLALELLELRTRGCYLSRLRSLSREQRAEWYRREQAALGKAGRPRPGAWVQPLKTFVSERAKKSWHFQVRNGKLPLT